MTVQQGDDGSITIKKSWIGAAVAVLTIITFLASAGGSWVSQKEAVARNTSDIMELKIIVKDQAESIGSLRETVAALSERTERLRQ